eukprot:CAMPEP_0174720082 /NCGR_PEP_ID=MMETSP1094-20130205/32767_1 /TAXON_ID=156173 /ORGANISM="Chrysochromulina brevifilum, Strain UTEX LB 985" /LENGTH=166 /DNA_ID=CAMNT_0015920517 /DNA_START=664 /DNA_END=1162 /DNA_ORIENTATION=-
MLDTNALLDLVRRLGFLPNELVAWKGKDLQATRLVLVVELLQLGIPARRLSSVGRYVHDEHQLSAKIVEGEVLTRCRKRGQIVEIVRELFHIPIVCICGGATDHALHHTLLDAAQEKRLARRRGVSGLPSPWEKRLDKDMRRGNAASPSACDMPREKTTDDDKNLL